MKTLSIEQLPPVGKEQYENGKLMIMNLQVRKGTRLFRQQRNGRLEFKEIKQSERKKAHTFSHILYTHTKKQVQ